MEYLTIGLLGVILIVLLILLIIYKKQSQIVIDSVKEVHNKIELENIKLLRKFDESIEENKKLITTIQENNKNLLDKLDEVTNLD